MATWRVKRAGEETVEVVTVYQLQQWVRTAQVGLNDEVSHGSEPFVRVIDEPRLARSLPESGEPAAPPKKTTVIAGVAFELDDDGKLLPPTPGVLAQILAQGSGAAGREKMASVRKLLFVTSAFLIFVGGLALLGIVLHKTSLS